MSVTRTAVLFGIMCAVLMASPLTANAFDLAGFVGISDRGSTKVKTCYSGVDDADRRGGRTSFSNKAASGVELVVDFSGGDGLNGDDPFDAFFDYGASQISLFSGVWSKIGERTKGGQIVRETYWLTPSGDLADLSPSGWEDLLDLINAEAGDACLKAPPVQVYKDLSDLVKATLVVDDKDPCAGSRVPAGIDCNGTCAGGSCMKAKLNLDVKAFMNDADTDAAASVKYDWVRFRYTANGYVVGSNPP